MEPPVEDTPLTNASQSGDGMGTLAADAVIGHYRIVRVIGRGGFGITYEAWDGDLNRAVAIKEYFPHGMAQRAPAGVAVLCLPRSEETYAQGLRRFLDEARALAQFHDPRIVRVHGYQQLGNTAYMVMDMERGTLLREQIMTRGPLRPDDARRLLGDLLLALQVIHGASYLHRDIKPGNIMRRADGQVVLLDFGSARQSHLAGGKGHTVVVTPGYAPIEQYDAETAQGPGIDLYATGASLLFCLTGASPPDGFRRAIALQANEPDPVEPLLARISTGGAVAAELCEVVRWLMKPQAAQRPTTAQAVLSRLQVERWTSEATLVPPVVNLAEMRSIPARLVEPMRVHLESHLGAGATSLLFTAIRGSRSAQDFIDRVVAQVPEGEVRAKVADGLRRILIGTQADASSAARTAVTAPSGATGSGTRTAVTAVAPGPTAPLADEKTTQQLASELAKHIGPIANMLVKRNLAKAGSRRELVAILAAEIPEAADRAAFIKAVERIPAFAS